MKQINQLKLALLAAVVAAACGAAPAYAEQGSSNSGRSDSTRAEASTSVTVDDSTTSSESTTTVETHQGKADRDANRPKLCEAHKHGLATKFSHITANSQRIQDRIDDVLAKALAYQQSKQLAPADFDNLVAAAQSAKTASADSIAALKAATPTIDCNSTSVASDVAAFKVKAGTARDNLKAYRTAVKAVLKSLHVAKKADEGSAQ